MFLLDLQGHELVASVFDGAVPAQVCGVCVCGSRNVVKATRTARFWRVNTN